jgi:hypothetical protein
MRLFKLPYLIGSIMLMLLHWHTHPSFDSNLSVTSKYLSAHSILQSGLSEAPQFGDIELLEVEDDNESETEIVLDKSLVGTAFTFSNSRLSSVLSFSEAPILFYKSWQSYLQVFRI